MKLASDTGEAEVMGNRVGTGGRVGKIASRICVVRPRNVHGLFLSKR